MSKTGYYSHSLFRKHEMGPGHPECPERLSAIEDRLLISGVFDALERIDAPQATWEDIELAHDRMYVASLRGLTERLLEEQQAGGPDYAQIDTDTSINAFTFDAARHSAGAALAATDAVLSGELENAFCAIRPPGHHACRDKAMGFCFFNNVAIAALHAVNRRNLERVAVIDFDVHHGNGTEEIFKNDERVMLLSLFQHPFFPYCGDTPIGNNPNIVNTPLKSGSKGEQVREVVADLWRYKLEEFQPQIIFISAGFDGHLEDDMGNFGLVDADYKWITERIVKWAQTLCDGRIVSVLEGGYELSPLSRSVAVHVQALVDA